MIVFPKAKTVGRCQYFQETEKKENDQSNKFQQQSLIFTSLLIIRSLIWFNLRKTLFYNYWFFLFIKRKFIQLSLWML